MLKRYLWAIALLYLVGTSPPIFAQSQKAGTIPSSPGTACVFIGVTGQATVGIQITGSWSGTLQPEIAIQGQTPQNIAVTPTTSSTSQSTITANGAYQARVAGSDTFFICGSTVASGTANVYLDATTASSSGGGFGGGSGTITGVNAGYGLNGGGSSGVVTLNLDTTLPNGELAVTQPTCDTSNAVATDGFVVACLTSSGLLPQSGCQVESIAGTLMLTVGACYNYTINSQQYSSPLTTVTLATADPTNPRLDLIGVNTSGQVFVTTGTPAVNPVEPSVDPSTQFALTAVLVPANATSPSLTVVDIYHNAGPWTITSSGSSITVNSTANPYNGTNPTSILATGATAGDYVEFTDPASGTVTLPNYNNQVFYVYPTSAWPATRSISVQWFNGSTAVGSPVLLGASGTFGFDSSNTAWQQVAMPTQSFNTSTAVPSVRFTVSGSGATINFQVANITLQGGAASGGGGVFMTNRGAWNTTAAYNTQNVVTYLGVSWIALAANTNSAPSTSNANWQVMTAPCTTQQVLYNSGGLITCDAGFTYNPITHALTLGGSVNLTGATTFTAIASGVGCGSLPVVPSGSGGYGMGPGCVPEININGGGWNPIGTSSGTVTSFSAGNFSPLFTTSVATASSTPALSFIASNFAANTIFGNFGGSSTPPSAQTINGGSNCGDSTHALNWTNGTGFGCQTLTSTQTIANGTSTMGTSAISSGTCATVVTTTATGVASTDSITVSPNTDPTGVTGYGPASTGSLYIQGWPTSGNVNFKVCNNTNGSITPSALTLNWRVVR